MEIKRKPLEKDEPATITGWVKRRTLLIEQQLMDLGVADLKPLDRDIRGKCA